GSQMAAHPPAPASSSSSTICAVGSPQVCQSPSASWLEDPLTRPVDPAAPLCLLAPSTLPWPGSPLAPLGSPVPPTPPWSGDDHPASRDSTLPAAPCPSGSVRLLYLFGSTFVLCRSGSTADSLIHVSSSVAGAIDSTSALRILLVTVAHQLSISASASSTTCSTVIGQTPGVVTPFSSMAPPSVGSTVGRHHGCGLGPVWLLLLQVPAVISLAPPSIWFTLVPPVSSLAPLAVISTPDSVCHPPPEPPPKFTPIPPSVVSTAQGCTF
ncbi:hypothetical protein M9458_014978, partial [Cirrhinus mrigala]